MHTRGDSRRGDTTAYVQSALHLVATNATNQRQLVVLQIGGSGTGCNFSATVIAHRETRPQANQRCSCRGVGVVRCVQEHEPMNPLSRLHQQNNRITWPVCTACCNATIISCLLFFAIACCAVTVALLMVKFRSYAIGILGSTCANRIGSCT